MFFILLTSCPHHTEAIKQAIIKKITKFCSCLDFKGFLTISFPEPFTIFKNTHKIGQIINNIACPLISIDQPRESPNKIEYLLSLKLSHLKRNHIVKATIAVKGKSNWYWRELWKISGYIKTVKAATSPTNSEHTNLPIK